MSRASSLTEVVSVERRFQRSIRLDADLGQPDPLLGYVAHETSKTTIATTLKLVANRQGAFTWTGPYGGGKSSLALMFASCLHPQKDIRKLARDTLKDVEGAKSFFKDASDDWLTVAITGRRGDPVADLRDQLSKAVADAPGRARTKRSRTEDPSGRDVIERLTREADARIDGGVLVIIDEMGKYLEGAADRAVDIHFFQDLAEAANRSDGRLVVIGILHQAFERYAERLGSRIQDEWAKIQGRYVDIPVITAIDEVIDLLGKAISSGVDHKKSLKTAKEVANVVSVRRPGAPSDLAERLDQCWPLHPVAAALLGPITRRRFGQNERSLFGFLASAEPGGFTEFLQRTNVSDGRTYEPADLWDYLHLNLEAAILASSDGHRWAQAVDVIERSRRSGDALHERVAKSVAIIDLFHNGSGIAAELHVIAASISDASKNDVRDALEHLSQSSCLVFRRHLDAYAIFAGSDFDIDKEVAARLENTESLNVATLSRLADLRPILAKKHYFDTGTPRWYDAELVELTQDGIPAKALMPSAGSAGKFVLALPSLNLTADEASAELERQGAVRSTDLPVVVGLPKNFETIRALGRELAATADVQRDSPELEGDAAARREIQARLSALHANLEEELRIAFASAEWFLDGKTLPSAGDMSGLSRLASELAEETFSEAPTIRSELINRQRPSSNTNAALRALLHAIADADGEPSFGIDGYPAERGLASTVLEATGLYQEVEGRWRFVVPTKRHKAPFRTFAPLWQEADRLVEQDAQVSFQELYDAWEQPPYGLRRGVMPLLAIAFFKSRRDRTAIYVEGVFQPNVTDLVMDILLQDPKQVSMRGVRQDKSSGRALEMLAKRAEELVGWAPPAEPLPVAQALVEFVFTLPNWSKKAQAAISKQTLDVRRILIDADDPHQLFFVDLPKAVGATGTAAAGKISDALEELQNAYPKMISELMQVMLKSLKHTGGELAPLRNRAAAIKGMAGDDLKLNGFITRLAEFDGSTEKMADICGLVTSLPVSSWHDLEPSRAGLQLSDYAYRFRRVELFGTGLEEPTQTAVMVMAGVGETERSVVRRAQVSLDAKAALEPVIEQVGHILDAAQLDQDLLLAVLAEVAQRNLQSDGENDISVPLVSEERAEQ